MENILYNPIVHRLTIVFVGVVLIAIVIRVAKRSLSQYVKDAGARYRARQFISFVGYLVGVLFILSVFGDQIGGVHVAIGIAGAGVAFALQEVITSIAGWAAVSFGQIYRTGDRIQMAGIKGDVIDISVLRTTMMECGQWVNGDLYNGRIVRIANSFIFKEPVFNYSGDFPFLWDELTVPVKFGSDLKLAREILERVVHGGVGDYVRYAKEAWREIVKKYKIEDATIDPMITLAFTDNWVEFTLRYVVDFRERRITKDKLFTRILEEIEKTAGVVAIASTSTDIHLVETPPVAVRLQKEE